MWPGVRRAGPRQARARCRLPGRSNRNAIHYPQARLVVLLKLNASAAQLGDLRLQILHDPGRELVLGGPGRGGKQQEQAILAAAVEQCRRFFLASGESQLGSHSSRRTTPVSSAAV